MNGKRNLRKEYNFGTINLKNYVILKLQIICDGYEVRQSELINELLDHTPTVQLAIIRINRRKKRQREGQLFT